MRCAQKGCRVPVQDMFSDDCPVCGHPLAIVMEPGDEEAISAFEREPLRAADEAERAAELAKMEDEHLPEGVEIGELGGHPHDDDPKPTDPELITTGPDAP